MVMARDRLETDVVPGECAGTTTVLVPSGVTDLGDRDGSSIQPDRVVGTPDDVGEVVA